MDINSSKEKKVRKEVVHFYDTVSHQFSQTRKNWWKGLDFLEKYLHKNDRMLDFGCGNGRLLEMLYEKDLKVKYIGVDNSGGMIEIARSHYRNEYFEKIGIDGKLPFENQGFDAVVSVAVFHHLEPKMAKKELEEIRRVLKKDGALIITVWHLWNWKRFRLLLKEWLNGFFLFDFSRSARVPFSYQGRKGQKTKWRFCYYWRRRKLEKVIKEAGFEILESGYSYDKRNQKRNIYTVAKKAVRN